MQSPYTLIYAENNYLEIASGLLTAVQNRLRWDGRTAPTELVAGIDPTPILIIIGVPVDNQVLRELRGFGFQQIRLLVPADDCGVAPEDVLDLSGTDLSADPAGNLPDNVIKFAPEAFFQYVPVDGLVSRLAMENILCCSYPDYAQTLPDAIKKNISVEKGNDLIAGILQTHGNLTEGLLILSEAFDGLSIMEKYTTCGELSKVIIRNKIAQVVARRVLDNANIIYLSDSWPVLAVPATEYQDETRQAANDYIGKVNDRVLLAETIDKSLIKIGLVYSPTFSKTTYVQIWPVPFEALGDHLPASDADLLHILQHWDAVEVNSEGDYFTAIVESSRLHDLASV